MKKNLFILLSLVVKAIGILIILFAFYFYTLRNKLGINILLTCVICAVILTIGTSILKFGKRIIYIPTTIKKNPYLPLKYSLYLRPFYQDDDTEKDSKGKIGMTNIFPYLFFWGFRTKEEQLALVINRIAPLVAVGKPKEKIPHRGAIRYIISKENWKDELHKLIDSAYLIVIRLDVTDGIKWEVDYVIKYAIKNNSNKKLVFILPNDIKTYDYYFSSKDLFPNGFVNIKDYFLKPNNTNNDIGIVFFDENWTAKIKLIDYNARYVRLPLEKIYRIAFEDIFKRYNIIFSHPGKPLNYFTYSLIKILTYIIATGLLFFLAKFIYTGILYLLLIS